MRLVKSLVLGAWIGGWVLATGCVGSETTGPVGPKHPNADSYCRALAEAVCTQTVVEACYRSGADTLAADTESCISAYSQPANCNPLGHPYDYTSSENCIFAVADVYKDARISRDELEARPFLHLTAEGRMTCLPVFNAGGGVGAPCQGDQDCDVNQELVCLTKGATSGTCQVPEIVGAAEVCSGATQLCDEAEDLYCGSDDQCIRRPDVGGACSTVEPVVPCRDSARCVVDDATAMTEICEAKLGNGSPCSEDAECEGGFCIRVQGQTTGSCGAQLALSPTEGSTCAPFLPNNIGP